MKWNSPRVCNDCYYYKARTLTVRKPDGTMSYGDGTCTFERVYRQGKTKACPIFKEKPQVN